MLISEFNNKLIDFLRTISRKYYYIAFACLVLFTILYNGICLESARQYYLQAQNPFKITKIWGFNPWQESPLLPLIAFYTHLTSETSFLLLSFSISLIGLLLFALKTKSKLSPEISLLLVMLLFSHPVVLFMFSWPGMPDCLTFLFAVLLLFTHSYTVVILLCFLGGVNHQMVFFIFPSIFVLRKIAREKDITWYYVPVAIAPIAAGRLAVSLFLKYNEIVVTSRLPSSFSILYNNIDFWIKHNLYNLPHAIFSFQNMTWVVLALCAISVFSKHRAYFITFFAMQILFYALTFFTLDTTRVFAVLVWAPAFHCIIYSLKLAQNDVSDTCYNQLFKALCVTALFGLILPKYYYLKEECFAYSFNDFYLPLAKSIRHIIFP